MLVKEMAEGIHQWKEGPLHPFESATEAKLGEMEPDDAFKEVCRLLAGRKSTYDISFPFHHLAKCPVASQEASDLLTDV